MARSSTRGDATQLYRCTQPFSVFQNGVPVVFAAGDEVMGDDPILRTHSHLFEPAVTQVLRRSRGVEQATAAPGEVRAPVIPAPITEQREELTHG